MQYVMAMLGALLGGGLMALFAAMQVADWIVAQQRFVNPTGAENMHEWVYLGCLTMGLVVGWILGWGIGSRFKDDVPDV